MAFKGWSPAAVEFFEGLEEDNSRAYFTARMGVYDQEVRAPMLDLLDELEGEFGDSRVFRPNRDTRFSADKSPYKTSIAATVGDGYIQVSADGLMTGSGYYHMDPGQLDRYRRAVDDPAAGAGLESVIEKLEGARLDVHGTDPLKSAPRGYPRDHPRIELLRYKGLVAMKMWRPARWLGSVEAKTRIVEVLRTSVPLTDWLKAHVGDSRP